MADTVEARVTHGFRASPERVFDAYLDPGMVRRWMDASHLKHVPRTEASWAAMLDKIDALPEGAARA